MLVAMASRGWVHGFYHWPFGTPGAFFDLAYGC